MREGGECLLGGAPTKCYPMTGQLANLLVMTSKTTTASSEPTFIESARRAQIVRAAIDTIAEVGYGEASFAGSRKDWG